MKRDTVNLLFTVLTPLLGILIAWGFNAKLDGIKADVTAHTDAAVAGLKQANTEIFETQAAHSADMQKIGDWTRKIQDGETATAQNVAVLSIQVADMKSKLTAQNAE
jgi:hypothetical protein